MGPRLRVWSREIVERLDRRQVVETFEPGSIVVVHKAIEEGVTIGMGAKVSMRDAAFGLSSDGFYDAAIEAFDQAIGLRPIGSSETMVDASF